MSVMTKARRQRAVWWARKSHDRFGKWVFESPVEVKCRWDDETREFLNPQGEKLLSRSLVYVDREMHPGDRLMLGELESDTPDDPMSVRVAFEISAFQQNPNFKATEIWYTAILI